MCVCVCLPVPQHSCLTTCGSQFSLSIMWVPGFKLTLGGKCLCQGAISLGPSCLTGDTALERDRERRQLVKREDTEIHSIDNKDIDKLMERQRNERKSRVDIRKIKQWLHNYKEMLSNANPVLGRHKISHANLFKLGFKFGKMDLHDIRQLI